MPGRQDKICAWCEALDIGRVLKEPELPHYRRGRIYDTMRNIQARATQCRICYILTELHHRQHGTVPQLCGGKDEVCCLQKHRPRDLLRINTSLDLPGHHFPSILRVIFLQCEDTCKGQQGGHSEDCKIPGMRYINESQGTIDEHMRFRAVEDSILLQAEGGSTIDLKEVHPGDTFEVAFEGPRWSLKQYEDYSAATVSVDYQDWKLEGLPTTNLDGSSFTIQLDATSPNSTSLNLSLNHFSTSHSPNIDFPSLKSWVVFCEKNHSSCNREIKSLNKSDERYKIRCIDVKCLRVVPLTVWGRYVALSYVWGHQPKTNNGVGNNNSEYPPSIQFANLPQTIQDAITATRALGEQYLWVDALCINQKDEKDVKEQVGRMGLIFENAFFTIVASTTNSSFEGIPRFKRAKTALVKFNAVVDEARVVFKSQRRWDREIFGESWITRGWTYQEALLSRRCLFFGEYQVVFHCRETIGLEYIPPPLTPRDNTSASIVKYTPDGTTKQRPYQWNFSFITAEWDFGLYRGLLQDYSECNLSYQQDAVNAFSGVLSKFEEGTGQSFVFGLPRSDLINGLLWTPSKPNPVANGLFPTWTWANCPRSIYYRWDMPPRKVPDRLRDYNKLGEHESTQIWTETDDKSVLVCGGGSSIIEIRAIRCRVAQIKTIFNDSRTILLETELRALSIGIEIVEGESQYVILDEKTKIPVVKEIEGDRKVSKDGYGNILTWFWSASAPIWTPAVIDCASKVKAILIVEWELARQESSPYRGTLVMAMLIRFLENGNAERIGVAAVPSLSWEHATLIRENEKITLV